MRSKLNARNCASAPAIGSRMPTWPVASTASSTAPMNVPTCAERCRPTTSAISSGSSSGVSSPARTASSKSWQTYAMRSAQATTSPSGVAGAGRRQEWLRIPSSVSAHRFSSASVDVGAVDRVVVAAGQVRRQRLLGRVAGRPVPAVVRERDRLGERQAEPGRTRDAGGHLRDLDRVREAGAEVIVLRRDEHLALAREPPPRPRVLHPIEVPLEAQPERIGLLGIAPVPRADRPGRARCEQHVQFGLAPFAPLQVRPDVRAGVRVPNDELVSHFLVSHPRGFHSHDEGNGRVRQ